MRFEDVYFHLQRGHDGYRMIVDSLRYRTRAHDTRRAMILPDRAQRNESIAFGDEC